MCGFLLSKRHSGRVAIAVESGSLRQLSIREIKNKKKREGGDSFFLYLE